MFRITLCSALLASATVAVAQTGVQAHHPLVPSASTFGAYAAYGGRYGGTTAAGSAMQGMASVISAKGDYLLSASAAAINTVEAQRQEINNRQLWTNTYFEMRASQRAAVSAERGPPPTQEQIVRLAAEAAPKPLGTYELDPVSGEVTWPDLLKDNQLADLRSVIEQLLASRATYGRLGIPDQNQAGQAIASIDAKLQEQVKDVQAQHYVAAKGFLKSLMFYMTGTQL